MCLVLDNNQWGDFLQEKDDMKPIHNWLRNKSGKLVYSNHKEFEELNKKSRKILGNYRRAGKAKLVPQNKVEKEIKEIKKSYSDKITSNDIHILGLAKAGNIKVLCSKDKNLHDDFKAIIRGNIYQTKDHKHLLTKDLCP